MFNYSLLSDVITLSHPVTKYHFGAWQYQTKEKEKKKDILTDYYLKLSIFFINILRIIDKTKNKISSYVACLISRLSPLITLAAI